MENVIEFSKQDVCSLLGVNKETLKKVEQKKQLYDRLYKKGYILRDKIKKGRQVFYMLQLYNEDKLQYTLICENNFNTKEYKAFGDYFLYRTYNLEEPITKKFLSKICGVCEETIRKWDGLMIDNKILGKDGFYYVRKTILNKENKEYKYELTCEEEFLSYQRSSRFVKKIEDIKRQYINGQIDLEVYTELIRVIQDHCSIMEEKSVYKVSKYYLKQDKELYEEIKALIYKTYISEDNNYIIEFKK